MKAAQKMRWVPADEIDRKYGVSQIQGLRAPTGEYYYGPRERHPSDYSQSHRQTTPRRLGMWYTACEDNLG